MQKILIILLLVALGFAWKPSIQAFYAKMQHKITNEQADDFNQEESYETDETDETSNLGNYACDGRVYCSQMTSCEEATFFLEHCPGV